jgi:uncharacterized protein
MSADHIRYDVLVQEALRGMVRSVLEDVASTKSLPGDHHFFITFDTTAEGVRLSARLRAQYPEEMTIVMQHQFWDLKVADDAFEVGLSFGGVAERLRVPLAAITAFADPSVKFTLQFETLGSETDEAEADEVPKGKTSAARREPTKTGVSAAAPAAAEKRPAKDEPQDKAGDKSGAEVVRLDRFRKK